LQNQLEEAHKHFQILQYIFFFLSNFRKDSKTNIVYVTQQTCMQQKSCTSANKIKI